MRVCNKFKKVVHRFDKHASVWSQQKNFVLAEALLGSEVGAAHLFKPTVILKDDIITAEIFIFFYCLKLFETFELDLSYQNINNINNQRNPTSKLIPVLFERETVLIES
jgi:hypothetical protein